MLPLLKKRFTALFSLCFVFLFFGAFAEVSTAATILISNQDDVDGRSGADTVNLITASGNFTIEIISSGGVFNNKRYTLYGSAQASNIYIESLDGRNGKEIIVLYTESGSAGLRKLCIINRSKDYYSSTTPQPEKWDYNYSIISQGLKTDYDATLPIAVNNLVVTNLSGTSGKELVGVGRSVSSNFLFIIRYGDNSHPSGIVQNSYTFSGSVGQQFLIYNLDGYQGDEVIGFFTSGSRRSLYIVNNQLEYDGYTRNYSKQLSFSFGAGIQSSNIQVAANVPHFVTNNVVIANLGTEPGLEIVGLYRDTSNRLGLFNINYPKSNGYVDSSYRIPGSGIYTGNYNRLDDARFTIGNFGTNGKEVYGYYNTSSGGLGGAFVYWDNFTSSNTYQNLDNPDSNGNFSDSFHEQTSAGQTVASAIFSLIDPDGDGHHDGSDACPTQNGYIDGDGDGTCRPTDQCDDNPNKISPGTCGCGYNDSNQDGDQWLDCEEECDTDPYKRYPGTCGCGTSDVDTDLDGVADCNDGCPTDPNSIYAGECIPDNCPDDPYKYEPGICGCGSVDDDSDGDGAYDCNEECPYDPAKTQIGVCGCFNSDADLDGDGKADCLAASEHEVKTFYHTDQTGTPLAVTDDAGRVIWRATYLPFGEEYSVTGPLENNRRFIGKEKDVETGLTHIGARYLLGERFTSPDPVRLVDPTTGEINPTILADPQRLNLYAYGLNNPYRYIDPDGEFAVIAAIAFVTYALDAMMPKSTDVSNSRGALDYIDSATMIAPLGIIKNVSSIPQLVKGSSKVINTSAKQLQRKFKHAKDFGVLGNFSKANSKKFNSAINQHLNASSTKVIQGKYRGNSVTHHLNPKTGLNAMTDSSGKFISGWRLGSEQLKNVKKHGGLN